MLAFGMHRYLVAHADGMLNTGVLNNLLRSRERTWLGRESYIYIPGYTGKEIRILDSRKKGGGI